MLYLLIIITDSRRSFLHSKYFKNAELYNILTRVDLV